MIARNAFYWIVRTLFQPYGWMWLGLRVRGTIPRKGPVLLVANHASLLDPAVLGAACPRPVRFLIKQPLYDSPGPGWFFRGMRAIPVRVEGEADHFALRAALRSLRAGEVVAIFPEGVGIDPEGRIRPPRSGAALVASRAGAPIVPVAIEGTYEALPRGRRWPHRGRVTVSFGEPFQLPPEATGRDGRQVGADEMMRRITALMEAGGGGG